ncbi:MAG: VWA domain-containing protein [Anaerolineales bacterium]|nr:VWA domain-containing protein [Anaerolineales bacterium]
MKLRTYPLLALTVIASLLLSACNAITELAQPTVTISIVYGSEKREWLEPLVEQFNAAKNKIASGEVIKVEATALGSIEAVEGIIAGRIQPTVWSPASSLYVPLANAEWRQNNAEDLITGNPKNLVLSPVVVAMWQPMAEALGWPNKPIGWADIAQLAISEEGWSAYGYPEWGSFKFGHTHPEFSNSGFAAVIAQAYAGAGKQRDLTIADLQSEPVKQLLREVQASIIHYGTSTGFFAERMFERGPSYLSAAVLYENLIVAQEAKRLAGTSRQLPVVAIYPKEGTFTTNHPYIILNAPWVTTAQKEAAEVFEAFLLDKPQQLRAMELGFRPADPSIPFAAPLNAQHGVDMSQPKTELATPSLEVLRGIGEVWHETKKPVDLVAVVDISGSMAGEKIAAARTSLQQFIDLLDDRDRLQVILFNDKVMTMVPLSPLGEKRADIRRRVGGIVESGGTALYDSIAQAYAELQASADPKHIRAIVVLSDGQDTASSLTLEALLQQIGQLQEGGASIKIFTIAFGDDADESVLRQIAEATGARSYKSSPENIMRVYGEIATFF